MRDRVITEADTCREFVTPRLVEAGWNESPHSIGEQRSFTNGRIIVAGGQVRRGRQKRADYLLFYRRDYPLRATTSKSPSTALSKRSCSGKSAFSPPWPPAPARPASRSRFAGSCGTVAGTVPGSTGARRSCSSPTATFWSTTQWRKCSRPSAMRATRSPAPM